MSDFVVGSARFVIEDADAGGWCDDDVSAVDCDVPAGVAAGGKDYCVAAFGGGSVGAVVVAAADELHIASVPVFAVVADEYNAVKLNLSELFELLND